MVLHPLMLLRDTPHTFRQSSMHLCTHVSSAWGQALSSICVGSVSAACHLVPLPMLLSSAKAALAVSEWFDAYLKASSLDNQAPVTPGA